MIKSTRLVRTVTVYSVASFLSSLILGGLVAWFGVTEFWRSSELSSLQQTMPKLADQINSALSELENRLILETKKEQASRSYFDESALAILQEFPFVHGMQVRDRDGSLTQATGSTSLTGDNSRNLQPGHWLMLETALRTYHPAYSIPYRDSSKGFHDELLVNLFSPARPEDRLSLMAEISLRELLRHARSALPKEITSGIDFTLQDQQSNQASELQPKQWIQSSTHIDRHGLRLNLTGEIATFGRSGFAGTRYLITLMGGLTGMFVMLWVRGLALRRAAKKRYEALEDKLQTDARIASLGEMSTAIAHELNQPLGAIQNYAYATEKLLKQSGLSFDPLIAQGLSQIRHEAARSSEVIKSIRSFIKREESAAESIDVSTMLDELKPLLEIQAHSLGCRIQIESEPGLRLNCSKALLQQVLLNMCRNGLEAMQSTPKNARLLIISCKHDALTKKVAISIKDKGHGISEEVEKSLFKPFFTTKKDGLGIGLNLCLSIAERQGGSVTWRNNDDGGACFLLELPFDRLLEGGQSA
jgi:signal transduction histidine kinase